MIFNILFVLLVSLLGCSLADSSCGPESCKDLQTVKTCKNVKYCIEEVWLHQVITVEKDDVCSICLKMVDEARNQLRSNETREEIKEVLDGSCKLIMLKPVVKACTKIMDEFAPELVEMLSSQMDPQVVCSVAKLCNNAASSRGDLEKCASCVNFTSAARSVLDEITRADFQKELLHFCRSMGSFSDACFYYTSLEPDFYYDQIKLALSKKSCDNLEFCSKNSDQENFFPPREAAEEAKNKFCHICPAFMTDLKNKFLEFGSPEELKVLSEKFCRGLVTEEQACFDFFDRHVDKIYPFFRENLEPVAFCRSFFTFCKSPESNVPLWPLVPASEKRGIVDLLNGALNVRPLPKITSTSKLPRVSLSPGDPISPSGYLLPQLGIVNGEVEDCENCAAMFDKLTANNINDKEFPKKILRKMCTDVEKSAECLSFVDDIAEFFAEMLTPYLKPEKVCAELVSPCRFPVTLTERSKTVGACGFCKKTVDLISTTLDGSDSAVALNAALNDLCDSMPKERKLTCRAFMSDFTKQTFPSTLKNVSGEATCALLNLCEKQDAEAQKKNCKTCLLISQTLLDELEGETSEAAVRKVFKGLCKKFPQTVKVTCEQMVDKYAEELVRIVAENLTAPQICAKLHFCNPKEENIVPNKEPASTEQSELTGKASCAFCLTAMKMLINQLQDNKTEEAIRKALDGICGYLPEETRDTCKNLIDQYADDIIDMVIADFNASEICIHLKLCGPKKLPVNLSPTPFKNFDVQTNRVREKYHEAGACELCKFLHSSIDSKDNKGKAAEGLLALLVDVCMMDSTNVFQECAKIVSEEILPFGNEGVLKVKDVCFKTKICPEQNLLKRIHSAVQECAMCEALVEIIFTHKKMWTKEYDFAGNASAICSSVPADKKTQCESMLVSYGPSIVNLLSNRHVKPDDVCFHVKLCDESQQTKVDMPVTDVEQGGITKKAGDKDCMKGPGYWCKNVENARRCGTLPHCENMVWVNGEPPK